MSRARDRAPAVAPWDDIDLLVAAVRGLGAGPWLQLRDLTAHLLADAGAPAPGTWLFGDAFARLDSADRRLIWIVARQLREAGHGA